MSLLVFHDETQSTVLKKRSRRKSKQLSVTDFERVLKRGLSQQEAAEDLDVCLSVLKKQFYQLYTNQKWRTLQKKPLHLRNRLDIKFLVHTEDRSPKELDDFWYACRKSSDSDDGSTNSNNSLI